ncbi:MAG: putative protein RTF2 [Streblomastix strix]|uniref:Replication termination factor 2 n=1 Tax=Streblomastix strix TaxID=222440 RepID=A0A5J4WM73_9EUKA|nr:MAG: putative protein RTF2 [Streblomastix strix]
MGGDGGSFVMRTELVKTKQEEKQQDYWTKHGDRFFVCALTNEPLTEPIVADKEGNLFNKESFIREFMARKKQVRQQFPSIRSPLKDLITLHFTANSAFTKRNITKPNSGESGPWRCPIQNEIEVNGKHRFSYLVPCGHVISDAAILSLMFDGITAADYRIMNYKIPDTGLNCPICGEQTAELIPLAPTSEELNARLKQFTHISTSSSHQDSSINQDSSISQNESINLNSFPSQKAKKRKRSSSPQQTRNNKDEIGLAAESVIAATVRAVEEEYERRGQLKRRRINAEDQDEDQDEDDNKEEEKEVGQINKEQKDENRNKDLNENKKKKD